MNPETRYKTLWIDHLGIVAGGSARKSDYLQNRPVDVLIGPGLSAEDFNDDALGRTVTQSDLAGRVTSIIYDDLGRQKDVTDASGGKVSYTYDAAGQRLS